jgi:hypothetical protein
MNAHCPFTNGTHSSKREQIRLLFFRVWSCCLAYTNMASALSACFSCKCVHFQARKNAALFKTNTPLKSSQFQRESRQDVKCSRWLGRVIGGQVDACATTGTAIGCDLRPLYLRIETVELWISRAGASIGSAPFPLTKVGDSFALPVGSVHRLPLPRSQDQVMTSYERITRYWTLAATRVIPPPHEGVQLPSGRRSRN